MIDSSGEIAISTLLIIGAAVFGLANAAFTVYSEHKAGFSTGRIIGDTICAGVMGYFGVYTAGLTLYQAYESYCRYHNMVPATHINTQASLNKQLAQCAYNANAEVTGCGPIVGTRKHTVFAVNVNSLQNNRLWTEVSYMNGTSQSYATRGSVRFDVVLCNSRGVPIMAWDFKTGSAILTPARINRMRAVSQLDIPIFMIK